MTDPRDLAVRQLADLIAAADQGRGMAALPLAAAILDQPGVEVDAHGSLNASCGVRETRVVIRLPAQPITEEDNTDA